jgi:hypothetical protein
VRSAATAPKRSARRSADRRATARRPAPKTRRSRAHRPSSRRIERKPRQATPIPGRLVPLAVGRTASAVSDLADSGLVVRLTRGRLWIGVLAALLTGIVALNMVSLSITASSSETARSVEELTRQGSALRARLAAELSNERVHTVAATLGLIVPEPGAIRYRRPAGGDAAEAARRLRSGELTVDPAPAPAAATEGLPAPTVPGAAAGSVPAPAAEPEAEAAAPPAEPQPEAPPPAPAPVAGAGAGDPTAGGVAPP